MRRDGNVGGDALRSAILGGVHYMHVSVSVLSTLGQELSVSDAHFSTVLILQDMMYEMDKQNTSAVEDVD